MTHEMGGLGMKMLFGIFMNQTTRRRNDANLKKGDVVKIEDNYFVVVSEDNNDGVFFLTTPDAFVCIENSQTYTYGYANSGWKEINDNVIKVGHILFD